MTLSQIRKNEFLSELEAKLKEIEKIIEEKVENGGIDIRNVRGEIQKALFELDNSGIYINDEKNVWDIMKIKRES